MKNWFSIVIILTGHLLYSQGQWEFVPKAFYGEPVPIPNKKDVQKVLIWDHTVQDGIDKGVSSISALYKLDSMGHILMVFKPEHDSIYFLLDEMGNWYEKIFSSGEKMIRRDLHYNKSNNVVSYEILGESYLKSIIDYDSVNNPVKKIEGESTVHQWHYFGDKIFTYEKYLDSNIIESIRYNYFNGNISSFVVTDYYQGKVSDKDSIVISYDGLKRPCRMVSYLRQMSDQGIVVSEIFYDKNGWIVGGSNGEYGFVKTYDYKGYLVSTSIYKTGNILVSKKTYEYEFY